MIPMPGKIIVKQDGSDEQRGRVLVSQKFAEKDRPMTGTVLAVGERQLDNGAVTFCVKTRFLHSDRTVGDLERILNEELQKRPLCVKDGDRVVFKVFAGDGIEWTDGSMCRCVTEDDLLAVILE